MDLLPGWDTRLKAKPMGNPMESPCHFLPKSPQFYAAQLTYVTTAAGVQALVELAQQRSLSHIGIDTEFRYTRPGVRVKPDRLIHDPRSLHPLLLSVALVEQVSDTKEWVYPFVVDLRNVDILAELKKLFHVSVCFVGHFLKVELLCLWQLNLPEPRILWDTWVHEKAQSLGRNHKRYRLSPSADLTEEAQAKEEVDTMNRFSLALVSTCHRYGIPYGMEGDKTRLQSSFLTHPDNSPFSEEQIRYAAEDAIAAARLYLPQTVAATRSGILQHVITVEMPWTVTSARMEWNGVRVNPTVREIVLESFALKRPQLEQQLMDY